MKKDAPVFENDVYVLQLDGTTLLDTKPYVPGFDVRAMAKSGWISGKTVGLSEFRSDGRFC